MYRLGIISFSNKWIAGGRGPGDLWGRNQDLEMDSLGTGIGLQDWTVSGPESESGSGNGLESLRTGIGIEKIGTGNLWSSDLLPP